jgi:hypothetical protein
MAEYRPPVNNPENPGMGPWTKPVSPQAPLKPGTVTAAPPQKHDGGASHPVGPPEK